MCYGPNALNITLLASGEALDTINFYGYRGLLLYLNTPAQMGVPACVQLAGGNNT